MSMKFPIKITFDFDELEYLVFIEGIAASPEGRGYTEQEAVADFYAQLDRRME